MSVTKIIAANSKPIEVGGRALKQNYMNGNAVADNGLKLKVPFSSVLETVTFAYIYRILAESSASYVWNPNNNIEYYNANAQLLNIFSPSSSGSSSNNGRCASLRIWDGVSFPYVWNLNGGVGEYRFAAVQSSNFYTTRFEYLTLSRENGAKGNLNTGLDYKNPLINTSSDFSLFYPTYAHIRFWGGANIPSPRMVMFNRELTARELNFLWNNGNSNELLSKVGCIIELKLDEAEIINIGGTDKVAFRDFSGYDNHAEIIDGLPVGTLEEQRDYVNTNLIFKWVY